MWFVLDAVRKNPLTSKASVAKTEEEIKTWLPGDLGHNRGHAERMKKNTAARCRIAHILHLTDITSTLLFGTSIARSKSLFSVSSLQ